jgi:hypothetical protein
MQYISEIPHTTATGLKLALPLRFSNKDFMRISLKLADRRNDALNASKQAIACSDAFFGQLI